MSDYFAYQVFPKIEYNCRCAWHQNELECDVELEHFLLSYHEDHIALIEQERMELRFRLLEEIDGTYSHLQRF